MEATTETDAKPSHLPKLLVVDDEPKNIHAIKRLLRAPDIEIVEAASGEEALRLVLKETFFLVLMDVQMPGMDGFETANLILGHQYTENLPIIFVTAISKEEHFAVQGYETGAIDYMYKPLNPDILRCKVNVFKKMWLQTHELSKAKADLSQQNEQLEAQKLLVERSNKELEQFAYAASHDLREPLRMITSYLDLIEKRFGEAFNEQGKKYLWYATDGASRMKDMVNSLLEYSRLGNHKKDISEVSLNEACETVRNNLQLKINERNVTLSIDDLFVVKGNESLLTQLFQNLIDNAIKFNQGSSVNIKITREQDDADVFVCVKDDGIGIAKKHWERVFFVFNRLHSANEYEGTGIGLSTCKKIVELHGGRIWIESDVDIGSRFCFTLPGISTE